MALPHKRHWWLIATVLIIIAGAIAFHRVNQSEPYISPIVASIGNVEQPQSLRATMMPVSAATLQVIVAANALPPGTSDQAITAELYAALAYVSARTATAPTGPITVTIQAEPNCALHGAAYTSRREAQVFTCADIPAARAVNILAHEFVHQLAHDYYGDAHLQSDPILLEGWATWGAGMYWLGRSPDFHAFLGGQAPMPLVANHLGRSAAEMNTLYYQWASFVEYLLSQYGRDAFDRLYQSGNGVAGSADYYGIYGVELATLEAEWRVWLTQNR
ncbi:hypothetical protein [Chloroflexus sp.]|uniref:hypothetical protein n=1 Tax=Chloroflexus sp. TaxID=1904827 RepID=UPI002615838D|nr:hypothetical protein [uncultured Chloroflexus sp.]